VQLQRPRRKVVNREQDQAWREGRREGREGGKEGG